MNLSTPLARKLPFAASGTASAAVASCRRRRKRRFLLHFGEIQHLLAPIEGGGKKKK
jgi:hypothetical protein